VENRYSVEADIPQKNTCFSAFTRQPRVIGVRVSYNIAVRTRPLTLYVGTLQVEATPKDVLNQAEPLAPSFVNAESFRAFYWTGVKGGSAPIAYTVRGGNANGWQWSQSGQIVGNARGWFRVVFKPPAEYEWYRFEVSGAPQTLHSKITGVEEVAE
jgi:hypothetical protein